MKTAQKNRCEAYHEDAVKLVKRTDADIAYFDPPYNQHKYLGNYHIWETLSLWDKPATYGVAKKRIDCKDRTSDFNSKTKAKAAIETLIKSCKAPHIVLSYNNEGHVAEDEIKAILASARSELIVFAYDHKRHVGHKIGIFNQKGQKVGEESHARTTEYMFFATDDKTIAGRARRNMAQYLL
jgi:adenine-specific DNA-methyltransferase